MLLCSAIFCHSVAQKCFQKYRIVKKNPILAKIAAVKCFNEFLEWPDLSSATKLKLLLVKLLLML
jgi:hypothetical protein